jgi:hypothetical protein
MKIDNREKWKKRDEKGEKREGGPDGRCCVMYHHT